MLPPATSRLHWNYFLAFERDLELASRYIELCQPNLGVFSVELSRLLLGAASEVDVLAKVLCKIVSPFAPRGNIDDYRNTLTLGLPELTNMTVFVPRYGLEFRPWMTWNDNKNPVWWKSYNNVKHERNAHFAEATLENAVLALSAQLTLNYELNRRLFPRPPLLTSHPKDATRRMKPDSSLLQLDDSFYSSALVI